MTATMVDEALSKSNLSRIIAAALNGKNIDLGDVLTTVLVPDGSKLTFEKRMEDGSSRSEMRRA
jgi:hypothetical protein